MHPWPVWARGNHCKLVLLSFSHTTQNFYFRICKMYTSMIFYHFLVSIGWLESCWVLTEWIASTPVLFCFSCKPGTYSRIFCWQAQILYSFRVGVSWLSYLGAGSWNCSFNYWNEQCVVFLIRTLHFILLQPTKLVKMGNPVMYQCPVQGGNMCAKGTRRLILWVYMSQEIYPIYPHGVVLSQARDKI